MCLSIDVSVCPNRGVPQGARFDPYGPPGVPGFEPNRFARYVRRKVNTVDIT